METLPLAAVTVLVAMFARADMLVLGLRAGPAATGIYVAGYRPVEVVAMVPLSLIMALFPALSQQRAEAPDQVQRSFEKAFLITLAMMAGIAALFVVDSRPLVGLLYPPGFGPAAGVLSVLGLYLLPLTLDAATTALLLAQGRYGSAIVPLLAGVLILVAGNLALDPGWGAQGAAVTRLAAQLVAATLNAALALRGVGSAWLLRRLAGVGVAACLLALVLVASGRIPVLGLGLGASLYLAVLLVSRVVVPRDLTLVRGLVRGGQ